MDKPGFLEAYSPWSSRSTTPRPGQNKEKDASMATGLERSKGQDHSVSHLHRLSLQDYPDDCPKAAIRWFYAVDAPKRKPFPLNQDRQDAKPLPKPKKYAAFSARDSRSIESAFQKMAEGEDNVAQQKLTSGNLGEMGLQRDKSFAEAKLGSNTSMKDSTNAKSGDIIKVPVNEDFLFDVDVERRELAPSYWLGPIYDVRRGSWFYQEGSTLRPCDETLASQLEEGYVRVKPWRSAAHAAQLGTASQSKPETDTMDVEEQLKMTDTAKLSTESSPNVKPEERSLPKNFELQTQRLFGAYMNSVVTYQDAMTAWLLTDDFLSRMSSTVYQRFAGGGHLGGVKVVRGYSEASKSKDTKQDGDAPNESLKRRSAPPENHIHAEDAKPDNSDTLSDQREHRRVLNRGTPPLLKLERSMSNLDPAEREEEARQRDEDEIKEDYKDADGQEQGREIEHLILVTHGIGQRLGLRMENVNFIHDVNVLRKTLKTVYETSPDLQALNSEVDQLPKNCRVQVLPIVWRHLLDFPKQSFKQNREQDLGEADDGGEEEYPSLDNITLESAPIIRQGITDLALDILLYQSAYREHISSIVVKECNRVYDLFMQRNPNFSGKISLIGHSLGSAILFDILCQQKDMTEATPASSRRRRQTSLRHISREHALNMDLKFGVEDFYCLGSPLGLYQMLKGRKIVGRKSGKGCQSQNSLDRDSMDDPFLGAASADHHNPSDNDLISITTSSPNCSQIFNIFHPADPIAYRIEPLISNAMSSLKPQPLPYTKKGIFNVQSQGITGIGARVGQSVSGLWSSMASGVANSLLTRSLGLTADGQSTGAPKIEQKKEPKPGSAGEADDKGGQDQQHEHPPTLIDGELETLFAGFEKRRKSQQSDGGQDLGENPERLEAEERSKRLRREEARVRVLNTNGRVDFSIQEGVFDISLIASIASHLSYWADEDVSHFMISQLLSRQRILKRS